MFHVWRGSTHTLAAVKDHALYLASSATEVTYLGGGLGQLEGVGQTSRLDNRLSEREIRTHTRKERYLHCISSNTAR